MVAVVVHPLVEEIDHLQEASLGVRAAAQEVSLTETQDQRAALVSNPIELVHEVEGGALAVAS